jgi:hypothetical protein
MIYFVGGVGMAVSAAVWLAAAAGGFVLYRTFRLRALPWVAAYIVLDFLTSNVRYLYFSRLVDLSERHVDPHSAVSLTAAVCSIIEDTGVLLVVILLLTEVAVLAMRATGTASGPGLELLAKVHAHTRELGIALVLLALVSPLPVIIYYYAH